MTDPGVGRPADRLDHAIRYLEHFVSYRPGDWGAPQREKAEECLKILVERARRDAWGGTPSEELDEDPPNEWYDAAIEAAANDPGDMLERVIGALWRLHRAAWRGSPPAGPPEGK